MKIKKMEKEVFLSIICTFAILVILLKINFYNLFLDVQGDIKQLFLYSLSFLITIIGFILAIQTILLSFFNRTVTKNIGKDNIREILSSFYMLIKIISGTIVWLIFLFFITLSKIEIYNCIFFYILCVVSFFLFFYIIFSIMELVKNINSFFYIKNNYEEIEEIKKEQSIDFLMLIQEYFLKKMLDNNLINKIQFKNEIYELMNNYFSDKEEKNKIKKYLDDYYNWK